jgi:hypothetical protein
MKRPHLIFILLVAVAYLVACACLGDAIHRQLSFTHRAAADGDNRSCALHRSVVPAGRDHFPRALTYRAGLNQSAGSSESRARVLTVLTPRKQYARLDAVSATLPAHCAISSS